jgi:hypothetical protein
MRSKRKKPKSTILDSAELYVTWLHVIKGSFDLNAQGYSVGKINSDLPRSQTS